MLHEEENTNRLTPVSRAKRATRKVASMLISWVSARVEVPERVVRQRGEVDDGVDAVAHRSFRAPEVDEVLPGRWRRRGPESTRGEQAAVESHDLVAASRERGRGNGAQIPEVARDQNPDSSRSSVSTSTASNAAQG